VLKLKVYELEESSEVWLRLGGFYLNLGTFNISQKDEPVDGYFANVWFSSNSWYSGTSSVTPAFKSNYGVDALRIFDVCSVSRVQHEVLI